jgi:mRNA interferase MazF
LGGLPDPAGSGLGFRWPVVVVQRRPEPQPVRGGVCVPLTSNTRWEEAPGNAFLSARLTGLPKDSVANVPQILALDRELLTERAGKLPRAKLDLILSGIDVVMGR